MAQTQETQHALLIPWGQFAQEIGLISGLESVKLSQKAYEHTPQAKVLEFLVAILSGAKYLQDVSLAAQPLDKDVAVAQAWGQAGWADYTGLSRTLKKLTWSEVHTLVGVLERVSQPMIENELTLLSGQGRGLEYDGDLTGLPVSNTSRSYPNAAYGHMSDEIRLWAIKQAWSACKARATDGCGSRSITMLAIPSLAHKPKGSCEQQKNAADRDRRGVLNSCRNGSRRRSKAAHLSKRDWQSNKPGWQRRNAQKRQCPLNARRNEVTTHRGSRTLLPTPREIC